MRNFRKFCSIIAILITLTACQSTPNSSYQSSPAAQQYKSEDAIEIDRDVSIALQKLYETTPLAQILSETVKGILLFPNVVKGGFIVGAQYGTGSLRIDGKTTGYYNTVAASYGLQAGIQGFGYALFFMNDEALSYLDKSSGWEIGVGPTIVIVDAGVAKTLTTTTAKDDVYAFIFDQRGLMAGLSIQGSKITQINP